MEQAMTTTELRIKLENLQRQEFEIQKDKKSMMVDYRDQLKEVKNEILETLDLISDINSVD